MTKKELFNHLQYFIEKHPDFIRKPSDDLYVDDEPEEEIYTPRQTFNQKIVFYIEGGIQVGGQHLELHINFNGSELFVLALAQRIFRFPYHRVIGFELEHSGGNDAIRQLLIIKNRDN